jgi:hypothetical protein
MGERFSHGFMPDWQMAKACTRGDRDRRRFSKEAGVSVLGKNSISTSGMPPMQSKYRYRDPYSSAGL